MKEIYTGDAFGNELHEGDNVIAVTTIIQSYDCNDGKRELHKVAKWKIKWIEWPLWTYKDYLPEESIVHGLNLCKI